MAELVWNGEFKDRLKDLIDGEPYREVAAKTGVGKSTICAYLQGDRVPKTNVVKNIAHAYGVDPLWLMGADMPKYKETPGKTEGLSEDRQHIIDLVMRATDDEVRALRAIADQVLALRGK